MERLAQVIESVITAGRILAAEWQRPDGPRGAGDKADVDIEIEQVLRADLLGLLDCDFWGEETESRLAGAKYCWVVDPNDGTADFLRGYRGSALAVGLLRDSKPILGVVYAPVTDTMGSDCIAWEAGMPGIFRNGQQIQPCLLHQVLTSSSQVLVSTAARNKPELNAELCSPARFTPMPSIAYRLALAAAGDAIAGISLVPVGAHDVVAGHALLLGAHGVLLDQDGHPMNYSLQKDFSKVSIRCFGGAPQACNELSKRAWNELFT
ncbi:inositol monophosphatase family protein [Pseudomonas sp. M2(2023)]|uniref:inositol monophosphatase family protein n=1 Tax=Pseudomonas sp. M2(2023) TaxID=3049084 RepID=UPI0025551085|nr:inositol monophosphatase family protein [Pseudomonas sp. M2(2023)]WIV24058.1 inositol monophosphatase family protein [Pseudomonas sp. M2(2023)]